MTEAELWGLWFGAVITVASLLFGWLIWDRPRALPANATLDELLERGDQDDATPGELLGWAQAIHIERSPMAGPWWNRDTAALPVVDLLPTWPAVAPPLPLPLAVSMVAPSRWMLGPRPDEQLLLPVGGGMVLPAAVVAAWTTEAAA